MKRERIPLMLRLSPEIHAKIKAAATENRLSLNAEIERRLAASLGGWKR